jgi:uncharacterized protein YegP (UPF0339 family)
MKPKTVKIVPYTDQAGEYRWRAVSRNGRIIADCAEGYTTKNGRDRAIKRLLGATLTEA